MVTFAKFHGVVSEGLGSSGPGNAETDLKTQPPYGTFRLALRVTYKPGGGSRRHRGPPFIPTTARYGRKTFVGLDANRTDQYGHLVRLPKSCCGTGTSRPYHAVRATRTAISRGGRNGPYRTGAVPLG